MSDITTSSSTNVKPAAALDPMAHLVFPPRSGGLTNLPTLTSCWNAVCGSAPGFEPGVEVLQLGLTPHSLSKSVDLLNASARLMLLSSAEECPEVPRWLDI